MLLGGGVAPTLAICTTLGNSARQEMGTTSCRVRARVLQNKEGVRGTPPPPPGSPHGCLPHPAHRSSRWRCSCSSYLREKTRCPSTGSRE